jgi:hypothetical protein
MIDSNALVNYIVSDLLKLVCIVIALIVIVGGLGLAYWEGRTADAQRELCLSKGGFPLIKGSKPPSYYCFKENPLLLEGNYR